MDLSKPDEDPIIRGFKYEHALSLFTDLEKYAQLRSDISTLQEELRHLRGKEQEIRALLAEADAYQVVRARLLGELPTAEAWALETLARMNVFHFTPFRWDGCPEIEGVYVLFRRRELRYVGESQNIRTRLGQHTHRNFTLVRYLEVPGGKKIRRQLESRLIQSLNPPDNCFGRR